tara:strand:- start:32 stop:907 length:876 start_codon:yes stop_codon:yes gene_type:complete
MSVVFGSIEGVSIGQIFSRRKDLSEAGVHAPLQAGIWGGANEGACSIVLSGGYEDDIDDLDFILYTGHGGQVNKQQVADQQFTVGNQGLVLSCELKLPVRVIRGEQIPNGPDHGYRYDGLYFVQKYERVRGKSGFYVCRFHLTSQSNIDQLEESLKPTLKNTYERAPRAEVTYEKIKRIRENTKKIKIMYDYKCQVCEKKLDVPSGNPISIGAHIKAVGRPSNGPDVVENMLCLCPNHHAQFDRYSFYVDPNNYEIKGLDLYKSKKLNVHKKHLIDKQFLQYHFEEYQRRN